MLSILQREVLTFIKIDFSLELRRGERSYLGDVTLVLTLRDWVALVTDGVGRPDHPAVRLEGLREEHGQEEGGPPGHPVLD